MVMCCYFFLKTGGKSQGGVLGENLPMSLLMWPLTSVWEWLIPGIYWGICKVTIFMKQEESLKRRSSPKTLREIQNTVIICSIFQFQEIELPSKYCYHLFNFPVPGDKYCVH